MPRPKFSLTKRIRELQYDINFENGADSAEESEVSDCSLREKFAAIKARASQYVPRRRGNERQSWWNNKDLDVSIDFSSSQDSNCFSDKSENKQKSSTPARQPLQPCPSNSMRLSVIPFAEDNDNEVYINEPQVLEEMSSRCSSKRSNRNSVSTTVRDMSHYTTRNVTDFSFRRSTLPPHLLQSLIELTPHGSPLDQNEMTIKKQRKGRPKKSLCTTMTQTEAEDSDFDDIRSHASSVLRSSNKKRSLSVSKRSLGNTSLKRNDRKKGISALSLSPSESPRSRSTGTEGLLTGSGCTVLLKSMPSLNDLSDEIMKEDISSEEEQPSIHADSIVQSQSSSSEAEESESESDIYSRSEKASSLQENSAKERSEPVKTSVETDIVEGDNEDASEDVSSSHNISSKERNSSISMESDSSANVGDNEAHVAISVTASSVNKERSFELPHDVSKEKSVSIRTNVETDVVEDNNEVALKDVSQNISDKEQSASVSVKNDTSENFDAIEEDTSVNNVSNEERSCEMQQEVSVEKSVSIRTNVETDVVEDNNEVALKDVSQNISDKEQSASVSVKNDTSENFDAIEEDASVNNVSDEERSCEIQQEVSVEKSVSIRTNVETDVEDNNEVSLEDVQSISVKERSASASVVKDASENFDAIEEDASINNSSNEERSCEIQQEVSKEMSVSIRMNVETEVEDNNEVASEDLSQNISDKERSASVSVNVVNDVSENTDTIEEDAQVSHRERSFKTPQAISKKKGRPPNKTKNTKQITSRPKTQKDSISPSDWNKTRTMIIPDLESLPNGVRRSSRTRVKPLEFWRNERPKYEIDEFGVRKLIGVDKGFKPWNFKQNAAKRKAKNAVLSEPPRKRNFHDLSIHVAYDRLDENEDRIKRLKENDILIDPSVLNWQMTNGNESVQIAFIEKNELQACGLLKIGSLASKPATGLSKTGDYSTKYTIIYGAVAVCIGDEPMTVLKSGKIFKVPPRTRYSLTNLRKDDAELHFVVNKWS